MKLLTVAGIPCNNGNHPVYAWRQVAFRLAESRPFKPLGLLRASRKTNWRCILNGCLLGHSFKLQRNRNHDLFGHAPPPPSNGERELQQPRQGPDFAVSRVVPTGASPSPPQGEKAGRDSSHCLFSAQTVSQGARRPADALHPVVLGRLVQIPLPDHDTSTSSLSDNQWRDF